MRMGLRVIATFTLFFFFTTQCVSAAPGAGIELAAGRETPAYLSIDVPAELGTVDALYEAPNSATPQFVLHIQNAHANYQAQMKIKQLLGYMNKKYGFKTIFVEGATEKLNPDNLRLFPDQERNLKLCDELAKQGELTGAELFLMEQPMDGGKSELSSPVRPVEALGIEQTALYRANYDALKKVFGSEADVARFFKGFDGKLDRVASKTFTPETRQLIADWKRFEQGRREFMPFVHGLVKQAKKVLNTDLESLFAQVGWPQITRLLVIQQMEKELDKKKGLAEQTDLVNMLRSKGASNELITALENFSEGSIAIGRPTGSRTGTPPREVSPREVLERLSQEMGPKGFKFSDYPAFSLYAGYVTLRSELDPKILFEEIGYLFTQMLDTLAQKPEQKTLLTLYRDGELLRKLLHLELNRSQWRQVLETRDRVSVPALVARLKDAVMASGDAGVEKDQQVMPKAFSAKMDELFSAGLEFYDYAHKREAVFYKQMQTEMAERKVAKAILITGGFHTDGMSDLFRENAISYGIVTPRLSEKSDENLYRSVMLQNKERPFSLSYLEAANRLEPYLTIEKMVGKDELSGIIATEVNAVMQFGLTVDQAVELINAKLPANAAKFKRVGSDSAGKPRYERVAATTTAPAVATANLGNGVQIEMGTFTPAGKVPAVVRSEARGPGLKEPSILQAGAIISGLGAAFTFVMSWFAMPLTALKALYVTQRWVPVQFAREELQLLAAVFIGAGAVFLGVDLLVRFIQRKFFRSPAAARLSDLNAQIRQVEQAIEAGQRDITTMAKQLGIPAGESKLRSEARKEAVRVIAPIAFHVRDVSTEPAKDGRISMYVNVSTVFGVNERVRVGDLWRVSRPVSETPEQVADAIVDAVGHVSLGEVSGKFQNVLHGMGAEELAVSSPRARSEARENDLFEETASTLSLRNIQMYLNPLNAGGLVLFLNQRGFHAEATAEDRIRIASPKSGLWESAKSFFLTKPNAAEEIHNFLQTRSEARGKAYEEYPSRFEDQGWLDAAIATAAVGSAALIFSLLSGSGLIAAGGIALLVGGIVAAKSLGNSLDRKNEWLDRFRANQIPGNEIEIGNYKFLLNMSDLEIGLSKMQGQKEEPLGTIALFENKHEHEAVQESLLEGNGRELRDLLIKALLVINKALEQTKSNSAAFENSATQQVKDLVSSYLSWKESKSGMRRSEKTGLTEKEENDVIHWLSLSSQRASMVSIELQTAAANAESSLKTMIRENPRAMMTLLEEFVGGIKPEAYFWNAAISREAAIDEFRRISGATRSEIEIAKPSSPIGDRLASIFYGNQSRSESRINASAAAFRQMPASYAEAVRDQFRLSVEMTDPDDLIKKAEGNLSPFNRRSLLSSTALIASLALLGFSIFAPVLLVVGVPALVLSAFVLVKSLIESSGPRTDLSNLLIEQANIQKRLDLLRDYKAQKIAEAAKICLARLEKSLGATGIIGRTSSDGVEISDLMSLATTDLGTGIYYNKPLRLWTVSPAAVEPLKKFLVEKLSAAGQARSESRFEKDEHLFGTDIPCMIHWTSAEGIVFPQDLRLRNGVAMSFLEFLTDTWKVERAILNITGDALDVKLDDIQEVSVNYVKAGGEKFVFRVTINLTPEFEARTHQQGPIDVLAAYKRMKVDDSEALKVETGKFIRLGWTGLVPQFGVQIGGAYFEEWINGPTVGAAAHEIPLEANEVEAISSTWTRVGHELSTPGAYDGYPGDLNAGNMMYREARGLNDHVVVDLGGRVSSGPAHFLAQLARYYVMGDHPLAVKAQTSDLTPILRGVHKVLGDNAFEFFLAALQDPQADLRYGLDGAISRYLEENFSEAISARGPPIVLLEARVLKVALDQRKGKLDSRTLLGLTQNRTLVTNAKKLSALFDVLQAREYGSRARPSKKNAVDAVELKNIQKEIQHLRERSTRGGSFRSETRTKTDAIVEALANNEYRKEILVQLEYLSQPDLNKSGFFNPVFVRIINLTIRGQGLSPDNQALLTTIRERLGRDPRVVSDLRASSQDARLAQSASAEFERVRQRITEQEQARAENEYRDVIARVMAWPKKPSNPILLSLIDKFMEIARNDPNMRLEDLAGSIPGENLAAMKAMREIPGFYPLNLELLYTLRQVVEREMTSQVAGPRSEARAAGTVVGPKAEIRLPENPAEVSALSLNGVANQMKLLANALRQSGSIRTAPMFKVEGKDLVITTQEDRGEIVVSGLKSILIKRSDSGTYEFEIVHLDSHTGQLQKDVLPFYLPFRVEVKLTLAQYRVLETANRLQGNTSLQWVEVSKFLEKAVKDLLEESHFSSVDISSIEGVDSSVIVVAILAHGILNLNHRDASMAAQAMTALANALGAERMQEVLSALPANTPIPATQDAGKATIFVTRDSYEAHFAAAFDMMALNPNFEYTFISDGSVSISVMERNVADRIQRVAGKGLHLNVKARFYDAKSTKLDAVISQMRADTIVAISPEDRGKFGGIMDSLVSRVKIVAMEFKISDANCMAFHTGAVRLGQKIQGFHALSDFDDALGKNAADLIKEIPFEYDAANRSFKATNGSLQKIIGQVIQALQALRQTAIAA